MKKKYSRYFCNECGEEIVGRTDYSYDDFRFCSGECLIKMQEKIVKKEYKKELKKIGIGSYNPAKKQVKAEDYCGKERPPRKVLCQLKKGHKGSHRAIIFWE